MACADAHCLAEEMAEAVLDTSSISSPTEGKHMEKMLGEPKWVYYSDHHGIYVPRRGVKNCWDATRMHLGQLAMDQALPVDKDAQPATRMPSLACRPGSSTDANPVEATADWRHRGSATGWSSDAEGQSLRNRAELGRKPSRMRQLHSCWLKKMQMRFGSSEFDEDEDLRLLRKGYMSALYMAKESAEAACSAAAGQRAPSEELMTSIREVVQALERVDECPSHACAAVLAIERAVVHAGVFILEKMKLAECMVRDVMAWRAQLDAPLGNRDKFCAVLDHAWLLLGMKLNSKDQAQILHAHRQKVAELLPHRVFPSNTELGTRARGGKVREARNRPKNEAPGPRGRTIFII